MPDAPRYQRGVLHFSNFPEKLFLPERATLLRVAEYNVEEGHDSPAGEGKHRQTHTRTSGPCNSRGVTQADLRKPTCGVSLSERADNLETGRPSARCGKGRLASHAEKPMVAP